jgi:hypothetical protein
MILTYFFGQVAPYLVSSLQDVQRSNFYIFSSFKRKFDRLKNIFIIFSGKIKNNSIYAKAAKLLWQYYLLDGKRD